MQVKKKQFYTDGQVITYKWPTCLFFQEKARTAVHAWWEATPLLKSLNCLINKSYKACALLPCFSPLILLCMHDTLRNILFSK